MWKPGPLPPGTYNWGGVVPADLQGVGFFFADFCGDSVKIVAAGTPRDGEILKPDQVAFFNNSLDLPPCCKGTGGRITE